MRTQYIVAALCTVSAAVIASNVKADVIFSDDMDYADSTAARAVWKNNSASIATSTFTHAGQPVATPANGPFMTLNNRYAYVDLPAAITGDWSLAVDVLHSNYGRWAQFGLTNATGDQGYLGYWSSSTVDVHESKGYVRLMQISQAITSFDPAVDAMTNKFTANHMPLGYNLTSTTAPLAFDSTFQGFAKLVLDYKADTHTLTLKMDGATLITFDDTTDPYTSFQRIYLFGNTTSSFDNVELTTPVPEPASLAAMTLAGTCLLLARRRK